MNYVTLGPIELMCIYLLPALLIILAIVWAVRYTQRRKERPPHAQQPPIEPKG